ncbi:hypothetical protein BGX21_010450 [Mortierella sp. AD011]|nr:hypothetical protein BGX20_007988 [Mortierella sp. AD010]KAF9402332.1 hypothetical protein BGX21_010450 [Mortierella sp. AD011]
MSNQDFLNLPTSPPPALAGDPSMQLFNPSEQRYFSEFLDTLVVDQDFTFDPSSIPNLPNLPLFTSETMPGGFSLDSSFMIPSSSSFNSNPTMINSNAMDFDMTSPSSQSSFSGSHSFPNHFSHGSDSPTSPDSPSSSHYYTHSSNASAPNKRRANKSAEARRTSSISQDSSKISTLQQLSKLSLDGNSSNGPSNPKKNKRDEEEHPSVSSPSASISSPSRSREQKEDKLERHASVSDGSISDAANGIAGTSATTKRKPYKELLTEEEKRANHIASEQKRRNTIRNGFKDMTEIIPDLKDVNSSKSTILFKAVDFIKHLERQNRMLQEKANKLESRLINQRDDSNVSGLDDTRLQDIPHIYPVPCNR